MTLPTRSLLLLALATAACNGASDDSTTPDTPNANGQQLTGNKNKSYTKTKYPIVLAHGLFGFDKVFGLEYFYNVPPDLESGGAKVYLTQVSAENSTEIRGEQLLKQVERIAAMNGGKVNLIGHSQGGMDARYVMGVRPDLIASLTTVGSPHKGADFADFVLANTTPGGFTATLLATFGNAIGELIDLTTGEPQDITAALGTLSAPGAAALIKKYPAGIPTTACGEGAPTNGAIPLYSWTGTSKLTNPLDLGDVFLGLTSLVYTGDNDGLVGQCSAHFGKVLRDSYDMNHLDEVNGLIGLTSFFETDPIAVYRAHANRLATAGL